VAEHVFNYRQEVQCHMIIFQWPDCSLRQVKSAADLFRALVIATESLVQWAKLSIETLQFTIQININVGWFPVHFPTLPSRSPHHQGMLLNRWVCMIWYQPN
jgi:hypothetical protein